MSFYQQSMHDIDPSVNPAGVEARMRLQYRALDHLAHETFVKEVQTAKDCEAADPGYLKGAAESYGMAEDYQEWENKMEEEKTRPGK